MQEFFTNYGLFIAKSLTVFILVIVAAAFIFAQSQKTRKEQKGQIKVEPLNRKIDELEMTLKQEVLCDAEFKADKKKCKHAEKQRKKSDKKGATIKKKRLYVLDFDGDVKASEVENLREEVTAVLLMARPEDEVLVKIESPGGMVHAYGLAASQLQRIVSHNIPLTVAVDAVAASGGYMMACIANKIIAAPFAIIGSIGVLAQVPNFHRLLKKNDIDYELFTAGEYKRTVTVFGENTEQDKEKFKKDLEETHVLFKDHVKNHRPEVDIEKVATGEIWYGSQAVDCKLVDELMTSDEYLLSHRKDCDIYAINYEEKQTLQEKLGMAASAGVEKAVTRLLTQLNFLTLK